MGRVAVLRALYLGDLLCAVPALRSLRSALPDAEVTLIGLPWSRELLDRYPAYLDRFIPFPGYPGLPEQPFQPADLVTFLSDVRSRQFDLVIQMHGDGNCVNELIRQMGAASVAGFCPSADDCPREGRFLPYPNDLPEVRRHLALMKFLGFSTTDDRLEFPLRETDFQELERLRRRIGLWDAPYVCVHPGGRSPARRWAANDFAAVADEIAAMGFAVLLTGSSGESGLVQQVSGAMGWPATNLSGQTGLGSLAALLSQAALLVCNDTGISHLAAAVGTPSVVISTRSDPVRWRPLDRGRHRFLINDPDGGQEVRPADVVQHAQEQLQREPALVAV